MVSSKVLDDILSRELDEKDSLASRRYIHTHTHIYILYIDIRGPHPPFIFNTENVSNDKSPEH